jgi:release factor glutamine methyltransferase
LAQGIQRRFDIVAANLPYIKRGDLKRLQAEVRREPRLALDGGTDGLVLIRRLIAQAPGILNPGGCLFLEIGMGQAKAVTRELKNRGYWTAIRVTPDLAGIPRIIEATLKEKAWIS